MNRYFGHHTLEGEWHALLPRYMMLEDRIQGAHILDIGCGSGLGSSLLLELGASAVDAIDHRPGVLELARMKHAKEHLDFHVMLWEELDFDDDSFDLILCLDPSSPVTDPNLLREVRRVLKPGGQYICAIERSTSQGMEALLPRYGYAEITEHIELYEQSGRVPQVGELSRHFEQVYTLQQRPRYSFLFETVKENDSSLPAPSEEAAPEEEGATSESSVDTGQLERIYTEFHTPSQESASVELWFCGEQGFVQPTNVEVRLPYYKLIERLQHQVHVLQARQREQNKESFDELLDAGSDAYDDTTRTVELERPFDKEITQVKQRPLSQQPGIKQSIQLDQLDAQIQSLESLHRRVRTDFERILFDAQSSLDERQGYIDTMLQHQSAQQAQLFAKIAQLESDLQKVTDERNSLLAQKEASYIVEKALDEAIQDDLQESSAATTEHDRGDTPSEDESEAQEEQ